MKLVFKSLVSQETIVAACFLWLATVVKFRFKRAHLHRADTYTSYNNDRITSVSTFLPVSDQLCSDETIKSLTAVSLRYFS